MFRIGKYPTEVALCRQDTAFKSAAVLDIMTDAMLISIPMLLLSRAEIYIRRKLARGSTLCFSAFMIVIAIIRIAAGNHLSGRVDPAWASFWTQVEACVAVIVVSVSAFRTLYVEQQKGRYKTRSPDQSSIGSTRSMMQKK